MPGRTARGLPHPIAVLRRLAAFVAMLLLVAIVLLLLWRVYLHHTRVESEETSVVGLRTTEEKIFRTLS